MDKLNIFNQAVNAARAVVQNIQNNQTPNFSMWAQLNEPLLRYVFFHEHMRTQAQYLENLVRQSANIADTTTMLTNAQAYITEAESISFEDGEIEYQVPFDSTWTRFDTDDEEEDEESHIIHSDLKRSDFGV